MIQSKKLVALLSVLASFWSSSSYALDVSAMGGLTVSNFNQASQIATTTSSSVSWGLAGLAGFEFMPFLALESGLFYMKHKGSLTGIIGTTNSGSLTFETVSLPVMLRFSPLPFLAVEGGGYFGLSSNASISSDASPGASLSYNNTNKDNGLIAGATLMMPLLPVMKLRLSAFYEHGLTNLANSGSDIKMRNIDILAGVMLSI